MKRPLHRRGVPKNQMPCPDQSSGFFVSTPNNPPASDAQREILSRDFSSAFLRLDWHQFLPLYPPRNLYSLFAHASHFLSRFGACEDWKGFFRQWIPPFKGQERVSGEQEKREKRGALVRKVWSSFQFLWWRSERIYCVLQRTVEFVTVRILNERRFYNPLMSVVQNSFVIRFCNPTFRCQDNRKMDQVAATK